MRASERSVTNSQAGPADRPFGEFLADLRILFHPDLLDGAGWERVMALAHRLPIHVIENRFGFEFDLCDPDPAADFCVVPPPGSPLAQFYVRRGELASPDSAAAALGTFLADQARDPHSYLAEGSGGIILEYDLARISSLEPADPGIFIVPSDTRDQSVIRRLYSEPEPLADVLWAVSGWTPDDAILRQMQRIYRLMPPSALVTQAGILPGRPQRAIRLIIGVDPDPGAVETLAQLGWSGSAADAAAVCEALSGLTTPVVSLSVDVTPEGISPRVGLEFHRPAEWHELDRAGWGLLADRLEDSGWSLPEKARGLKEWPRVEQVFDATNVYRVQLSINHVKVVVDRGTIAAKAYAGVVALLAA